MNRNRLGEMPEITRATYKSVKKMDRQQFEEFCKNLYGYGFQDGKESVPGKDIEQILEAIAEVSGIGPKKMEDIRERVNGVFEKK